MMIPDDAKAIAVNVILGVGTAVVVFGSPVLPAIIGGVGAGALLLVRRRCRQ